MTEATHILAIDQGTTSTRAILFDRQALPVAVSRTELPQHYPADGWVEHDPEDIWRDTVSVCRAVLAKAGIAPRAVSAIGITNQRETAIIWDRATGVPIHRAIVWQDRRTADRCARLKQAGHERLFQERTGLLLDPYFSGTKIAWLLDHVAGARERAERGELAFGTVDCFLLWRLTGGAVHATDATNASRTLIYDIRDGEWSDALLRILDIPRALLPQVHDNSHGFGIAAPEHLGASLPITGMAGDQQSATFGQACFEPGMIKSTYGTGCFALMNTGDRAALSEHRMLTTIGYRLGGRTTYAIEGAIFVAGAAVKWLRDGLGLIASAAETGALAADLPADLPADHGVYLVPAFTGLGAPHWHPAARAALSGMTLDTGPAHLARAALESVAYQTRDLMEAMVADGGYRPAAIRVDGGMVVNDWLCQFLADMLDIPVERPMVAETTSLGAAYLAGLETGFFESPREVATNWNRDRRFDPAMDAGLRARLYEGWQSALARTLGP